MASTDALPIPRKNVAFRVTFPIYDKTGSLVSGAAGLDSEVSKDQGSYADCTNEATEIGSSGTYYLDLTATEMNADGVAVIVKTTTTDAKTTLLVFYPMEDGDLRVNVVQFNSVAGTFASGRAEVNASHAAGTAWNSGAIGAATFATDAIGSTALAASAVTEIQAGLATAAALATLTSFVVNLATASAAVAAGANTATSFVTTLTETATDHWADAWVLLTSGPLLGQISRITAYNGSTKTLTVARAFSGTPGNGVTFTLINR